MNQPRVLITGVSGFLGYNLARDLTPAFSITGSWHTRPPSVSLETDVQIDLGDPSNKMTSLIDAMNPDLVVHAAAIAQPDVCEADRPTARQINVTASAELANAAAQRNIDFIFISTDLVYGRGTGPHNEENAAPQLYYAELKYEAENMILSAHSNAVIFRCALIYGPDDGVRTCFVRNMDRTVRSGQPLKLFTDQWRTPVWAPDIAAAVRTCFTKRIHGQRFNIGGPDRMTRYEMGLRMADILHWPVTTVHAVRMADIPHLARRPSDCSLDSGKAIRQLAFNPVSVQDGILRLKDMW